MAMSARRRECPASGRIILDPGGANELSRGGNPFEIAVDDTAVYFSW
jgi:hypothetical protein